MGMMMMRGEQKNDCDAATNKGRNGPDDGGSVGSAPEEFEESKLHSIHTDVTH